MAAEQSTSRAYNFKDLSGQVVGDNGITIIRLAGFVTGRSGKKKSLWLCRCRCKMEFKAHANDLRCGRVKSCGCWRKAVGRRLGISNTRHGKTGGPEYVVWRAIVMRCHTPGNSAYANYGAKGIQVCERWRDSFESFLADMGPRPSMRHTIDRYPDQRGNYEPGNCRWATMKQQNRNKGINTLVTIDGATRCVAEWAEMYGIHRNLIYRRLETGWSPEAAVKTPPIPRGGRLHVPDSVKRGLAT